MDKLKTTFGPNSQLVVEYCGLLKQAEPESWTTWAEIALAHPLFSLVAEDPDAAASRIFDATEVPEPTTMVEATMREGSAALLTTLEHRFAALGETVFVSTAHALVYTSVTSQLDGDNDVFGLGQEGFFYPSTVVEPIVLPVVRAASEGASRDRVHRATSAIDCLPNETFEMVARAMRWVFDAAREVAMSTPAGTLKCVKALLVAPAVWVVGGVPEEAATSLEQIPNLTLATDQIRPLFAS